MLHCSIAKQGFDLELVFPCIGPGKPQRRLVTCSTQPPSWVTGSLKTSKPMFGPQTSVTRDALSFRCARGTDQSVLEQPSAGSQAWRSAGSAFQEAAAVSAAPGFARVLRRFARSWERFPLFFGLQLVCAENWGHGVGALWSFLFGSGCLPQALSSPPSLLEPGVTWHRSREPLRAVARSHPL
ncbi:unnamed protein product [Effrenium voratum]|nr:unnamed protein product [Effrenium voratum]